jgi:hypothetical protein
MCLIRTVLNSFYPISVQEIDYNDIKIDTSKNETFQQLRGERI